MRFAVPCLLTFYIVTTATATATAFQSSAAKIQIPRGRRKHNYLGQGRGFSSSCFININSNNYNNYNRPRTARGHPHNQWYMNIGQSGDGEEEVEDDDNDDDDDDDDDDYMDDVNLEDWRNFRKRLVESSDSTGSVSPSSPSSSSSSSSATSSNSSNTNDDHLILDNPEDKVLPDTTKTTKRFKSVSKANEELLKTQSEILHAEGIWAHESSVAEVGGLLLRMPLEVEIYRNKDQLTIGKELNVRLEKDGMESNSKPLLSSSSTGALDKNPDLSFSLTAAQTLLWYKKTQSLIDDEMSEIVGLADERGQINSLQLGSKATEMLGLYLDNRQSWQEVCLVAERNVRNGDALTYVLNRPMAFRLNENLARLVLFGAFKNAMDDGKVSVSQMNLLTKFLRAFEQSCGIYIGGPDGMDDKAVLLHGISDLDGAEEIAPGTRIYRGGLEAAIEGVLQGKYKPLDFRFVVGCHKYKSGELERELQNCKHQPVACSRALALKQCIQLPKPLWHEVMELCGGELREISRLELLKRDDIPD